MGLYYCFFNYIKDLPLTFPSYADGFWGGEKTPRDKLSEFFFSLYWFPKPIILMKIFRDFHRNIRGTSLRNVLINCMHIFVRCLGSALCKVLSWKSAERSTCDVSILWHLTPHSKSGISALVTFVLWWAFMENLFFFFPSICIEKNHIVLKAMTFIFTNRVEKYAKYVRFIAVCHRV